MRLLLYIGSHAYSLIQVYSTRSTVYYTLKKDTLKWYLTSLFNFRDYQQKLKIISKYTNIIWQHLWIDYEVSSEKERLIIVFEFPGLL